MLYDLDVLRNRPDAYGHLGVARDLAAHFGARRSRHAPHVLSRQRARAQRAGRARRR